MRLIRLETGGQLLEQRLGQRLAGQRREGRFVLPLGHQLLGQHRPQLAVGGQQQQAAVFGRDQHPARNGQRLPVAPQVDVVQRQRRQRQPAPATASERLRRKTGSFMPKNPTIGRKCDCRVHRGLMPGEATVRRFATGL